MISRYLSLGPCVNSPAKHAVEFPNIGTIIDKSISSVLNRTFEDFEVLVIDNGSTDNTKKIINLYDDCRIRYFFQDGSGTPASPRNHGIRVSKGNWICFLDSDDWWDSNKLKRVFDEIQSNDSDVICHNEKIFYTNSKKYGKVIKYNLKNTNIYKKLLLYGNALSTSAISIRKIFLINNKLSFNESENFCMVEDYDLWMKLASCGAKFSFLQEVLGFYTIGSGNLISDKKTFCSNLKNVLFFHIENIQKLSISKEQLQEMINIRIRLCEIVFDVKINKIIKAWKIFLIFLSAPYSFIKVFLGFLAKKYINSF